MTTQTPNLQKVPGHQVLAAAGKTVLRPGGRAATERLFEWANFQNGDTVLELAASFGLSAIALARQFGVQVVGVERNPESVARARANIEAAGLQDRVRVVEGDIFHLEELDQQFDHVLAEAILTMQSPAGKAKLARSIGDRLKPGGKFLSHELLVSGREEEVRETLSEAIRVNASPLSEAGWKDTLATANLEVQRVHTGRMGLLDPGQIVQDEGLLGAARFGWNVLTRPQVRQRVLQTRRAFQNHRQDLGYIVLLARRKP